MAIEKASYQVLIHEGPFELRLYEPMIVVTSREIDLAGGDGFNRLFNYISGNNQESKKISMTAPVINYLEDQHSPTSFVMPKQYRMVDLPQPNDSTLKLKEVEGRQVAVVSFSGAINSEVIKQKKIELLEWLNEKQMITVGVMELARYNPPFVPAFIRRNELMIGITMN